MKLEDAKFVQSAKKATSRIQLWIEILKEAAVQSMAEVGVWKGEYAEEVLKQCEHIRQYYMIDPWATLPDWNKPFNVATQEFREVYNEAMKRTEFAASKRIVLQGRTKEVIDQIPDNSLDFAYIDGDHTLRGITIDLMKLLPKIKEGGLLGGDDFTNTPWQHDMRFEPTLVCPYSVYFAEAMDMPIAALPFNQFVIHKTSQAKFTFLDTVGMYGDIGLNRIPLGGVIKSAVKGKVKKLLGR
jgi:hypothetical protein